jgi:hypothetical protein
VVSNDAGEQQAEEVPVNFAKRCHKTIAIALLTGLLPVAGSLSAGPQLGPANQGLRMNVRVESEEVGEGKVPKFRVELQNAEENDLVLNLGIMLANGRKQYPTEIVLILTDAQGKARRFDLRGPAGIAGRMDPLIVPLPAGSVFSISVDLEKYWPAASNEFDYKLKPGTYFLEARFSGKGLTQQEANLDVKGLALMPYWTGSISSNKLGFEVPGK